MLDSIVNSINKTSSVKLKEKTSKNKTKANPKTTQKPVIKTAVIEKPVSLREVETSVPETTPATLPEPTTSNFFQMIMQNIDQKKFSITEAEKTRMMETSRDLHDSLMGIIRKCNSNDCQQKSLCPFQCINKYPDGQLCPVEMAIAKFASKEYYTMLEDELQTTSFNIVEISTVNAIIEVELEEFRSRAYIHEHGLITQTAAFAIKESGAVIYNDVENPIYNLRERLDRRKNKLLQRLLMTPESKARFKIELKSKNNKTTKDLISSAEDKIRQFALE